MKIATSTLPLLASIACLLFGKTTSPTSPFLLNSCLRNFQDSSWYRPTPVQLADLPWEAMPSLRSSTITTITAATNYTQPNPNGVPDDIFPSVALSNTSFLNCSDAITINTTGLHSVSSVAMPSVSFTFPCILGLFCFLLPLSFFFPQVIVEIALHYDFDSSIRSDTRVLCGGSNSSGTNDGDDNGGKVCIDFYSCCDIQFDESSNAIDDDTLFEEMEIDSLCYSLDSCDSDDLTSVFSIDSVDNDFTTSDLHYASDSVVFCNEYAFLYGIHDDNDDLISVFTVDSFDTSVLPIIECSTTRFFIDDDDDDDAMTADLPLHDDFTVVLPAIVECNNHQPRRSPRIAAMPAVDYKMFF